MKRDVTATNIRPRLLTAGVGVASTVALLGAIGAAPLAAADVRAAASTCWNVPADVDGGGPDVVVGLPSYDLPGKPNAGAIVVYSNVAHAGSTYPIAPSKRTLLTSAHFGITPQAGARFGAAVSVWQDALYFDDPDACDDLLVGAPGQNVAGKAGAGRVYELVGKVGGLSGVRATFDENMVTGDDGGAQAGAGFGSTIAADNRSTIAIGAPHRDIGSVHDAGRVLRLVYLLLDGPPTITVVREGPGEAGTPETGDRFGEALQLMPTGDGTIVIVGVPHESVRRLKDAGVVAMVTPDGHMSIVGQDSTGAGGTSEAGDLYGSSVSGYYTYTTHPVGMVVVGVPGEDVGHTVDAGSVAFAHFDLGLTPEDGISGITGSGSVITQDSPGVPGTVEAGDRYGSAVLAGEFGSDNGVREVVATSPYENIGHVVDAGSLAMTRTDESGHPKSGPQPGLWSQNSTGVSGTAERGDRFGAAVSSIDLTVLEDDVDVVWPVNLVTVPREDIGGRSDVGMAYLGFAPGKGSVALVPPVLQSGAGVGMVPMRLG